MPTLFHGRVIQKQLQSVGEMPMAHVQVLTNWARNVELGVFDRETQHDGEFIQRILIDVLGYTGSSAGDETWTLSKNQPIGPGNVDVALGHFTVAGKAKIVAPFELKGAATKDLDAVMPGRHKSPVQQAWEYAMDAPGAQWVLVTNYREIRLYAVGYGRKDYETFDLAKLAAVKHEYQRFMLLLSADSLLSGKTAVLLTESDVVGKEITNRLYAEYKNIRSLLIDEITAETNKVRALEAVRLAQTILDRVLFIAFAEDRGLLEKHTLEDTFKTKNPYSPQPAWHNFVGLFNAIDKGDKNLDIPGYNGGLFAADEKINKLIISEKLTGRLANLGDYDYESDVSVNILGHIFEQSVSDLEEIRYSLDPDAMPLDEIGEKRRTDGIFYTPSFVTQIVVEQTVGRWLADQKQRLGFETIAPLTNEDYASIRQIGSGKNKGKKVANANVVKHISLWTAYRDRMSSIRVVDPACGSGAFLNEVFDYLYREGQVINQNLDALHGGQASLFRWDTHILANNIFGVDINAESVEITKLSLWLKTANRNEKLSYLDDNIKVGNSLIKDESVAGSLAFDWQAEFPHIMAAGGFDVVVANPPYVDSERMSKSWTKEREYISRTFKQTKGNWDLYVAFLELGCNLISESGYLSFITPDKWISKDFGRALRARIGSKIISILPLGRGVFENALVDSIVTTIGGRDVEKLAVLTLDKRETKVVEEVEKADLVFEDGFDQVLSVHYPILKRLEATNGKRLGELAVTENACATSDTYILGEILQNLESFRDFDEINYYKVVNTGTLDRYYFRWGLQPMRYLKKDYWFPVVKRSSFQRKLGATYQRRAASPKLIIKGLTLFDCALDLNGSFIPGKSTLVICSDDTNVLKFIMGFINSKLMSFYITHRYASSSYNGGVNFTPDMVNTLPVPSVVDVSGIVNNVDIILGSQNEINDVTRGVYAAVQTQPGFVVRGKLSRWFEMTSQEFVREFERQGLDLSIRDKVRWTDFFDDCVKRVSPSVNKIKVASDRIEWIISSAFGVSVE